MKSLKFDHDQAERIKAGEITSTWRLLDDKNLSVNDDVRLIDKVDPARPETWRVFGVAHIDRVIEKRLSDIHEDDMEGHAHFASQEAMLKHYQDIYNNDVSLNTALKILQFSFTPL